MTEGSQQNPSFRACPESPIALSATGPSLLPYLVSRKSAFTPYNKIVHSSHEYLQSVNNPRSNQCLYPALIPPTQYWTAQCEIFNPLIVPDGCVGRDGQSRLWLSQALNSEGSSQESDKIQQWKDSSMEKINSSLKKSDGRESPQVLEGKKCCNCKKSRCLMLYCECFRSNTVCEGCNCLNCLNTQENNTDRLAAVRKCLQLNPLAFLGSTIVKASKGCKCKKSGCRKGYCQCYQQNKGCSNLCVCEGCHNQPTRPGSSGDLESVTKKTKTECQSF